MATLMPRALIIARSLNPRTTRRPSPTACGWLAALVYLVITLCAGCSGSSSSTSAISPTPTPRPVSGLITEWKVQAPLPTAKDLRGVSFLDDQHGWAVGGNSLYGTCGVIAHTDYDGATWQPQVSGTTEWLHSVTAVDARHVWAVGADGALLHYDGAAWIEQPSGQKDETFYTGVAVPRDGGVLAVGGVSGSLGIVLAGERIPTPPRGDPALAAVDDDRARWEPYLPLAVRAPGAAALGGDSVAGGPVPARVDLSPEMGPVWNQTTAFSPGYMMCGPCSAAHLLTQWVKHFKRPAYDMTRSECCMSPNFLVENGATGDHKSIALVLTKFGCVDAAEYPFRADGAFSIDESLLETAKPYRVTAYNKIWDHSDDAPPWVDNDIDQARARLAQGHALLISYLNYSEIPDLHDNPPSPFFDPPHCYQTAGHFVVLCGYDDNINPTGVDADHRGGFLLLNEWGENWNGPMRGYLWVSYAWVRHYVEAAYYIDGAGPDAPTLTACSPAHARVGISVTLTGTGFGSLRRQARVTFNGVEADCTSFTNDTITVTVPAGATSGPVVVRDWEGVDSGGQPFVVDP